MLIEEKLKELSIELPNPPDPVGNYLAINKSGNLLFISGQLPIDTNGKMICGKIGDDLSDTEAERATKIASINILGQLNKYLGNLNKVKKCVKIIGYYNCIDKYSNHPKLLNTASDLMVSVFGDKGKHARAVIGTNSLPLNAAVELDSIFEV